MKNFIQNILVKLKVLVKSNDHNEFYINMLNPLSWIFVLIHYVFFVLAYAYEISIDFWVTMFQHMKWR